MGHIAMLHAPQRLQLQPAERLHEGLQAEAFIGLNLPQRRRLPMDVESTDGLGRLLGGVVDPVMAPHVDGGRAGIVAPILLHVVGMGIAEKCVELLASVSEVDQVSGGHQVDASASARVGSGSTRKASRSRSRIRYCRPALTPFNLPNRSQSNTAFSLTSNCSAACFGVGNGSNR
jgi:hypothetical protein